MSDVLEIAQMRVANEIALLGARHARCAMQLAESASANERLWIESEMGRLIAEMTDLARRLQQLCGAADMPTTPQ
jgi:hypothetical protein